MLAAIKVALGGTLVLFGRKLFWLFVGGVGFGIGAEIAARFFNRGAIFTVLMAIVLGFVFTGLAILAESVAIGLAGFLSGGFVALNLTYLFGLTDGRIGSIAFLAGGVLGVAAIVLLFDWALISLSALAGAALVSNSIALVAPTRSLLFVVLVLLGVLVQGVGLRADRAAAKNHPP